MTKTQWAGWIASALLAAFLIFGSAAGKFTEWEGKAEMFEHLGYSAEVMTKIGIVEIVCAILFVIPRTGFLGALLLTAYLGGATATHVRVAEPFFAPIIMAIVLWLALGCRQPDVFALAFGGKRQATSGPVDGSPADAES